MTHFVTRSIPTALLLVAFVGSFFRSDVARSADELDQREVSRVKKLVFFAPEGWPSNPPKIGEGLVMFAPEKPDWRKLGFRPNLSVKINDNPGMNLDDLKKLLEDQLVKNLKAQKDSLVSNANAVLSPTGQSLKLEDLTFDLQKSTLKDGFPCLTSESFGIFSLNGKIIKTKTCSMAFVDSSNVYTATIVIPLSHERELKPVWEKFKAELRFEQ